jgi:hypothetical protein
MHGFHFHCDSLHVLHPPVSERDLQTLLDDSEISMVSFLHWVHGIYADFLLPNVTNVPTMVTIL